MFTKSKSAKVMLILFSLFFISTLSFSSEQRGGWVEFQLPDSLPDNWLRAVGGNCLIYVDQNDNQILAFDINVGEWQNFTAPTGLAWNVNISAGTDVALVFNDSILVGYSALNQGFSAITYDGSLLNDHVNGHGCHDNLAYFTTGQKFYVYDAEGNQWYNYDISDIAEVLSYAVMGGDDYLFLFTNESDTTKKIVAFSHITKTFDEHDSYGNLFWDELEHGFVFYNNTPASDSIYHFLAGYSAYVGAIAQIPIRNFYEAWNQSVARGRPGTSYMFTRVHQVLDDRYRLFMYGFDTRHGNYIEATFDYDYPCNENCPYTSAVGDRMGIQMERNDVTGALTQHIFNGDDNAFAASLTSLAYPTCSHTASPVTGGVIYAASDCNSIMFYDMISETAVYAGLPPPTESVSNPIEHYTSDNWAAAVCERVNNDTAYIYSYNQNGHNIQEFKFENAGSSVPILDSLNVYGLLANYNVGPYLLYLYSPGTDSWTIKDFGMTDPSRNYARDYIYYNAIGEGNLTIFDGVTGVETVLPFGYQFAFYFNGVIHRDNFLIAENNTDNTLYGYSCHTRSYSVYTNDGFPSRINGEDISVYYEGQIDGINAMVTYNSLYDYFVPFKFTPEQNLAFNVMVGDRTALVMTQAGHLLAFNPYIQSSDVAEEDPRTSTLPQTFTLRQNYPNPFNASTVIEYSLPRRDDVVISVYNILGQKVFEHGILSQPAGDHDFIWSGKNQNGEEISSGIYLYQVKSGHFLDTKKMILLK